MWPFNRKNKNNKEKKNQAPSYIKICPRCNSINIQIRVQGGLSGLTALGLPTFYKCKNCGFVTNAFPEINLNDLKKKEDKKNKDKDETKTTFC